MGRRTTAIVAVLSFFTLAIVVTGVNGHAGADAGVPTPPSTYLAGPDGASAVVEALERMAVRTDRWRRNFRLLGGADTLDPAPLFVVLGPAIPLIPSEAQVLVDRARQRGPILIAGPSAAAALRCFGWDAIDRGGDSIAVRIPGAAVSPRPGWVHFVLVPAARDTGATGKEQLYAGVSKRGCEVPVEGVDTLLETTGRRPVLVRVRSRKSHPAYLLSDPAYFSNAVLRRSDAGPGILRFLATSGAGVRFDEFHQGFNAEGDLVGAVLAWSEGSPWGWGAWQLLVVGLVALLAAIPRRGPIRQAISRARRSPLEHVRALATALRAARGHDVAVDLLVRGLRRRLSRDGRGGRESGMRWLERLQGRVRTTRARAAAARLGALTRPGRSAADVLAAANAVEDVWQELRP